MKNAANWGKGETGIRDGHGESSREEGTTAAAPKSKVCLRDYVSHSHAIVRSPAYVSMLLDATRVAGAPW